MRIPVESVRLRPLYPGEERVRDAPGEDPWNDFGDPDPDLPAHDPAKVLVVEVDGSPVGEVQWHAVRYGPNAASIAWNIGISVLAQHRGCGIGTLAQRMLAAFLFSTTPIDRVEASTDVENLAEQRALEKAGFTREGVLRGAQQRRDARHDLVGYSLLRTDVAR